MSILWLDDTSYKIDKITCERHLLVHQPYFFFFVLWPYYCNLYCVSGRIEKNIFFIWNIFCWLMSFRNIISTTMCLSSGWPIVFINNVTYYLTLETLIGETENYLEKSFSSHAFEFRSFVSINFNHLFCISEMSMEKRDSKIR